MTGFEILSVSISGFAVLVSLGSMFVAGWASRSNVKMLKRAGVIELYAAWQGVSSINRSAPVTVDAVKGANAIALTASLWNHDIIEKAVLYQMYWEPYRDIYDSLYSMDELLPGHKKTGKAMITDDMKTAYRAMEAFGSQAVVTTRVR
ncbi:hypothetical protein MOQ11_02870 [Stenotrophomonas maltophilia]|uniref:hypothetical protein n=1 Tax=Stenotrophomonas maltophilia TaxID=40324 RepID=UPI001311CEA0|nr:hypothetical protein [Stenotrophomonas maltophilia]MBH1664538.1 hypothetical protein [Stenotrophomonas maltophilia]MCI1130812.1 hypothetical protein [Stenotrophomonas maltophilia]